MGGVQVASPGIEVGGQGSSSCTLKINAEVNYILFFPSKPLEKMYQLSCILFILSISRREKISLLVASIKHARLA